MLQKQKFPRFELFVAPLTFNLFSVCMCVAPAISFLGLSPCEGPACPPVRVFMRGLSFLSELNLSTYLLLKKLQDIL